MYLPGAIGSTILKALSSKHSVYYNAELHGITNVFHILSMDEKRGSFWPIVLEPGVNSTGLKQFKQLWMPGCHADIGGGGKREQIAGMSLIWMVAQLQGLLEFDIDALVAEILDRFPLPESSKRTTANTDTDDTDFKTLWSLMKIEESLTWFWTICDICYRRPAGYPIRKGPHLRLYEAICAMCTGPYRLLFSESRQRDIPNVSTGPFVQQLHPLTQTLLQRPSYRKTWWNLQQRSSNTGDGEIAQMNALEQDIWKRVAQHPR